MHQIKFDDFVPVSGPVFKSTQTQEQLAFYGRRFVRVAADALDRGAPTFLFGLPLVNSTRRTAAGAIVARAATNRPSVIQFVNAHCINMMRTNPAYARALSHADTLLPDGSGIALAAKMAGRQIAENLNGTDLFPEICAEAAAAGQPLFLLGGKPGVVATVAAAMRRTHQGLTIAGTYHGYAPADYDDCLIDAINTSGASILLVGMGVPEQEIWIAKHRAQLTVPVILGVGGLFDYYSGSIPRAPQFMRRAGAEWVWRLIQEPFRLGRRYLVGNPAFMLRALAHAASENRVGERVTLAVKRGTDILLAVLALVVLAPLLVTVAALVRLDDGGPVLFAQMRIGKSGKPFRLWKFRSMIVNAERRKHALAVLSERRGACFKMAKDPRITRVGRWLRRTSIDELPQLFNIVRGEMSVVGPRPSLPEEVITYGLRARERLRGRPGLTCTWQVSGRAEVSFDDQVEMDIAYLRRPSLGRDFALIARTLPAIVEGRGAY